MSHTEGFIAFHRANPHVYKSLVSMARRYRKRYPGAKIGIKTLWENLRWDYLMRVDTDEDFKLNNNYTSHYARLIMACNPELEGIFELREQRAA